MKVATILPQKFLGYAKEDDYHMALAHLIGKAGFEHYTEFFYRVGHEPKKFLMMDTGLIEGNERPIEELIQKAKYIQADEMALNDVFMDREGTLVASAKALAAVKASGLDIRTMAIPQGNCLVDWIVCAQEMLTWDVDTIGIPKVLYSLDGPMARIKAVQAIQNKLNGKEIHLLGCWETPMELKMFEAAIRQKLIVPVRGVDSAIAYAYARQGYRITESDRPEGAINFAAESCDLAMLAYNIGVVKHEAQSLEEYDPTAVVRYL